MAPKTKKVDDLPEFFTEYCPQPYDRHTYTVFMENGSKFPFDDFIQMRNFWFKCVQQGISNILSHVEIVDKKEQETAGKGF